ncbi:MAG TPA: hypothetical protein ENI87_08155 [bacterium]|nr:hypothetical protein [bacterium]
MNGRTRFRYLREPLFVLAAAVYVGNVVWKHFAPADATFARCYLGDTLCLPVCVPLLLWLQRRSGVRGHDLPPSRRELLGLWLLWTVCFEWLGPRLPLLAPGAVSDPWDALAYAAGGLFAGLAWCRSDGGSPPASSAGQRLGRWSWALAVALAVLSAYRIAAIFR